MAKILRGNLPKKINVIIDRKVYKTVEFDETGIFETDDEKIIKELKDFGYAVEAVEAENHDKPEEVDAVEAVEANKAKVKNKKGSKDEI